MDQKIFWGWGGVYMAIVVTIVDSFFKKRRLFSRLMWSLGSFRDTRMKEVQKEWDNMVMP